jgi:AcrR family transcriptional regulator
MLSEAARDRGASLVPRRRAALYPKLRPGPHGSAQESIASNQRARLYGAMIELVADRGYEASTVWELCALAGVSKRTLYERFPGGKEDCFLATYDIIVRRAQLNVLAAGGRAASVDLGSGRRERLHAVVEAFAHEVATHPNAARLVLVESQHAGPAALARVARTTRDAERLLCWGICDGADALAPSPQAVRTIVADGARLVRARLRDRQEAALARLAVHLSDLCALAAFKPSRSARAATTDVPRRVLRYFPRDRNRSLL